MSYCSVLDEKENFQQIPQFYVKRATSFTFLSLPAALLHIIQNPMLCDAGLHTALIEIENITFIYFKYKKFPKIIISRLIYRIHYLWEYETGPQVADSMIRSLAR